VQAAAAAREQQVGQAITVQARQQAGLAGAAAALRIPGFPTQTALR
jgi:hypothetical protein